MAEDAILQIKTLGALEIRSGGAPIALPASRKTRALLGYLALTAAPQRRERLCELFWELPDDPRAALRWSLSKLRPVINAGGCDRLVADRQRVFIDPAKVTVDLHQVQAIADDDEAPLGSLALAWEDVNQVLMEDCELSNQPDFSAWLEQQRNEGVRLRIRLARRLALAPHSTSEEIERWAERWLADAPFDHAAARHAVASRRQMGRERNARDLALELEERFREAGLAAPDWSDVAPGPEPSSPLASEPEDAPRQVIRFARAEDDLNLAWASVGDPDKPPLVKAANWLSHLELDWEAPIWSPLFRELARSYHFVRYDERGCGLSDWDAASISFDSFVADLEVVADAAGLQRFPLLGISQGAAVSIEFAARHPERVSHLVLFGGYAAGWRPLASEEETREREAVMVLTETGWGRTDPTYRHIFSKTFMPTATAEELDWFDDFQRRTTSPRNAVRFLEAFSNIDVRSRLKEVQAPTLVVHSSGDRRIPASSGREIAAQIPNTEFSLLESENHLLLGREPASSNFIACVRRFLGD